MTLKQVVKNSASAGESYNIPKHNDLIYDVGMHKGEDTDYYLRKGFRVIAFEADPDLVSLGRVRFQKEIVERRLILVEGAIVEGNADRGEKGEQVRFFKNSNSVWGTVVQDWADRNEQLGTSNMVIEVPAIKFSDCLIKYGIPYYMKIDIEGMDLVCLRALRNFLIKPDYISIESEKVRFSGLTDEFNLFRSLGYDRFQAVNQEFIEKQVEPANTTEGHFTGTQFKSGASGLFGTDLRGRWLSRQSAIIRYVKIFLGYKLFGDDGILQKYRIGRSILFRLNRTRYKPQPGWYDTHAKHCSVKN